MRVNGVTLNNLQSNFLKEILGDTFMGDVRAEAILVKTSAKYGVDLVAVLEAINKNFATTNAEFKNFEAQNTQK
jgi:hypothetical protein